VCGKTNTEILSQLILIEQTRGFELFLWLIRERRSIGVRKGKKKSEFLELSFIHEGDREQKILPRKVNG
jgi:hypothetical protein